MTPRTLGKSEIVCVIWVCVCCYMVHCNGECCDNPDHGGDGCDPLSELDGYEVTAGFIYDEHEDECLFKTLGSNAPGDYECDCQQRSFSTSGCEGCGSRLYGERHALTLWTAKETT